MRGAVVVLLLLSASCSPGQATGRSTPTPRVSSWPSAHAALSSGGIVEHALPSPPTMPTDCSPRCRISIDGLVRGPDGNIWFEDITYGVIGRITPTGAVTEFPMPVQLAAGANSIAAGPDGNLWATANGGKPGAPDGIVRITPAGQVAGYSAGDNPGSDGFGTGPESITAGPDGNLWFTEFWTNRIGRLSPAGVLTEFPIPTGHSGPRGIVTGLDGNVWFVESTRLRPAIARITPGGVVTEYQLTAEPTDNTPWHIVSGPDGDLWFNEPYAIGHISTSGKITWMSLPEGTQPGELVAGPDGNIWFADQHTDSLVRLGVTGALRKFALPRRGMYVLGMAVGRDGRIWFGEGGFSSIASIGVKVPEILMSRKPLVFDSPAHQTIDVRNTGEAPLVISSVRVTGVDSSLFTKGADSCAGATLPPDRSCKIDVGHLPGGPAGIQAAMLEISSNATGSPQRLQLLAQPPQCTLPVIDAGAGQQLAVPLAEVHYDASGNLGGKRARYFDRAYGRWLPVDATAVSPDGRRYAYFPPVEGPATEIRIVDVQTGAEKSFNLPTPTFWQIVAFTADGIYMHVAYEGLGPGASLLDPETGAIKHVLSDAVVAAVDGSTAWLTTWNTADKLPNPSAMGGGSNQLMSRDLATGRTATWLYRPGTNVYVVAVWNGSPVVSVYDGLTTSLWIVTAPNGARILELRFNSSLELSTRGFVGDSVGLWVGSDDGVYLWTPRAGAVLVTERAETPAGTCA
jgi:streptogramin lyase